MLDTTKPPWRILEAPAAEASGPATGHQAPAGATAPTGSRIDGLPLGRIVVSVIATVIAIAITLVLIVSGGTGSGVVVDGGSPFPSDARASAASAGDGPVASGAAGPMLVVEIVGAVQRPGVYRVAGGSRVGDVLAAAGGYGVRVDTRRAEQVLKLAALVRDGDQVRVPSRDDPEGVVAAPGAGPGTPTSSGAPGPIDLNAATSAELDALPGIGPVTVEKIIAARAESRFASVDDLRTRGLVGQKTFDRIRASLTVH